MQDRSISRGIYAAILVLVTSHFLGCGGYPKVSDKTYDIAKALYVICNQRSADRLPKVTALVEESLKNEEIGADEARWLTDIVEQANNGEWTAAAKESRRIMEDQVGR